MIKNGIPGLRVHEAAIEKGGRRQYELSNHLGNVMATLSDVKTYAVGTKGAVGYLAKVTTAQQYYPFGMQMPGKNVTLASYSSLNRYRFGFNGMEKDDEVKGGGNSLDFQFRIYDSRLGKFLSNDPWSYKYPNLSTYQFANNTPIWAVDIDGLGWLVYTWYMVSKKELSGTNHKYVFEKMKTGNGKIMTSSVEDKSFDGTKFNNWYVYNGKLYKYPYEIPGYTASIRAQEERTKNIAKDVLVVAGGIAVTIASGGSGTGPYAMLFGVTSGVITTTGGSAKLALDIRSQDGDKELAEKIPTGTVDALIGVPLEAIATIKTKDDKVGKQIRFSTQVVDGFLDIFDLKEKITNIPELAKQTLIITNITIEANEKIKSASVTFKSKDNGKNWNKSNQKVKE